MSMESEEIPKLMMDMLSDKPLLVETLMKSLLNSDKIHKGLEKVLVNFDEAGSPENREKQLKTCIKYTSKVIGEQRVINAILLSYISAGNFDADTTKIMAKMGNGQDALKQMIKNKFGGTNPFS